MRCIRRHKQGNPRESNDLLSVDDFIIEANLKIGDIESTLIELLRGEWFYTNVGDKPLYVYFLDNPVRDE